MADAPDSNRNPRPPSDASAPHRRTLLIDPHPGTTGRWQPTRAGVVNSWAWAEEQFLFRNGWHAMVGKNGTGKSVTGEILFPTLLDGNVTPKALAIPAIAKWTLGERHSHGDTRSPKTGLWWQEFGRTPASDAGEPETEWLTLGLWMHRGAGTAAQVERAWILVPTRVGDGLAFADDGEPVDISTLAQQVAARQGRMFTSVDRLAKAAARHLSLVTSEDGYREAVRETLFSPVDSDQFEALTAVLRALRAVQVNAQHINPESMQATLSAALPSLDVQRVERLAKALTKTEQFQQQLHQARDERDMLTPIQRAYRRYAATIATFTAAELLDRCRQHDRHVAEHATLAKQRSKQLQAKDTAELTATDLRNQRGRLEQTIDVLRQNLSGHQGAGLPQLDQHVAQLEHNAADAEQAADAATSDAENARRASDARAETATDAASQASSLATSLAHDAEQIHAVAYSERISHTTTTLLNPERTDDITNAHDAVEEAVAPLQAWAAARVATVQRVREANAELRSAQTARQEAEDRASAVRTDADTAAAVAYETQEKATDIDAATLDRLHEFAQGLQQLPQPPSTLLTATPIDPDAILHWADMTLHQVTTEADVAGTRARAASAAEGETKALREADEAHRSADVAQHRALASADTLAIRANDLPEPSPTLADLAAAVRTIANLDASQLPQFDNHVTALAATCRTNLLDRQTALHRASQALDAFAGAQHQADDDKTRADRASDAAGGARDAADAAERAAATEATDWVRRVHVWAQALRVMDPADLRLPSLDEASTTDPDQFAAHVAEAYNEVARRLTTELAMAENRLEEISAQCRRLDAEILDTQQRDPTPEALTWRADRTHRAGAPLWAIVDFVDTLPDDRRGPLEGALLAAGLLDAWVSTDGTITAGDSHLTPGTPLPGPTLSDLLAPDANSVVPKEQVRALLSSIRVTDDDHRGEDLNGRDSSTSNSEARVVVDLAGTARTGILTARTPTGWTPRHIGPTAREQARQRRVAVLRNQRAELQTVLVKATTRAKQAQEDTTDARQERSTLPRSDETTRLRRDAQYRADESRRSMQMAQTAAQTAEQSASHALAARAEATEACGIARAPSDRDAIQSATRACTALPELVTATQLHAQQAGNTRLEAHTRRREADTATAKRIDADRAAALAAQIVERARTDRQELPDFDPLREARRAARDSAQKATIAADAASAAEAELHSKEAVVRQTLTALHRASQTKDGYTVPTDPGQATALQHHVERLKDLVANWGSAAERAHTLLGTALDSRETTESALKRASEATSRAQRLTAEARAARHQYNEEKRVYGADYQQLINELAMRRGERDETASMLQQQETASRTAENTLAAIDVRFTTARERQEQGERDLGQAVQALQVIFDEGIITELAIAESLTRPETTDTARATAETILADRDLSHEEAITNREAAVARALRDLDSRIRNVRDRLFRRGRYLELEDIPSTRWRRIVVTEQSDTTAIATTSTKSLHMLLDDLQRSIQVLEADFDEQLRTEIKGAIFTDLRKHISVRIALAHQIVDDITSTLEGVRTGVERVGIKLAWEPMNEDPIASEALALIQNAGNEGEFDRMYNFFIRLLSAEDKNDTATERIRRVFDYRTWHHWKIQITHNDFREPGQDGETFRDVKGRKNPLNDLSTGEKRLVTMLPLLAAARAFYLTAGYSGPHMIFIDELDAAFDTPNLRMLLALLHEWDFDLMTTLPSMSPLLAAEAGSIAIHKINKHVGGTRYTVPFVWDGRGQPCTARIQLGKRKPNRTHPEQGSTAIEPTQDALFGDTPGAD